MEETPENKIANGPPRNRHERRQRETQAKHRARQAARREERKATKAKWKAREALEAMDGVYVLPEGVEFFSISIVKDPPDPRCRIHSIKVSTREGDES